MCSKKRKYKLSHGFSLAETLLAVMILSLVASLLTSSLPTIINVYNNVTVGANARIVLSTTVSSLRNELATAKNIVLSKLTDKNDTINDYNAVTYYSTDTQAPSKIYISKLKNSEGEIIISEPSIILQQYAYEDAKDIGLVLPIDIKNGTLPRQLVPTTAATENLYVTYGSIELSKSADMIVFKNLTVKRLGEENKIYASLAELNIGIFFGPATTKD